MSKKENIYTSIDTKKSIIQALEVRLAALTTGKASIETGLDKLYSFRDITKLNRSIVDAWVGSILIHGGKEIEIVWNDCF